MQLAASARQKALRRSVSETTLAGETAQAAGVAKRNAPGLPPPAMREAATTYSRRRWQHVLLAFASGALLSYTSLTFNLRMMHPSLGPGAGFGRESPWWWEADKQRLAADSSECSRARGISLPPFVPGSNATAVPDKLIVAARHDDDTSWLDVYLSHIPHVVYQVDDPEHTIGAQHATLANKGNEAMGYLQFIVDYYDRLPDSIVFLHGHRGTWHMKDHIPILKRLRWGHLPYANLRYSNSPGDRLDWECGERTEIEEFKKFDCDWQGSHLQPAGMKPRKEWELNVGNKDCWWDSIELREVWPEVYEAELGPPPKELRAPCCAEFMVSRERIQAHPRAFYAHLRDWIVETELGRYRSGRTFEYMWHVIFGEDYVIEAVPECELLTCDTDEAEGE